MRTHWLRLSKVVLVAVIVAIAVTVPIGAAQKGKPATIPLQVTFNGAPEECGIRNDLFTGDGAPIPYKNGFQKVSVWINDDDSKGMNFETSPFVSGSRTPPPPDRRVSLRLCGAVLDGTGGTVANPWLQNGQLGIDAFAFLYSLHPNFDPITPPLRRMEVGDTWQLFFYIQWPRSNPQYRLWWGQTGGLPVQCTLAETLSDGTERCHQWKAFRSALTGTAGRAQLYKVGKTSMTPLGEYYDLPFEMTIEKCQTANCP